MKINSGNRVILAGVVIGICYWFFESAVDAFLFHEGTFGGKIFHPTAFELWTRLLIVSMIIGFSVVVQFLLAKSSQLEEQLRASRELQSLIGASPIPLAVCRASDGVIMYANKAFSSAFNTDGLTGVSVLDFCSESERSKLWETVKSGGSLFNYELRLRKTDNTWFWAAVSLQPLRFDGEPAFLYVFYDITELKQAEVALRKSEEGFRSLLESVPEAIVVIEEDRRITMVNAQCERMLGYKREELIGKHIDLLLPEKFREKHATLCKNYFYNPVVHPMGIGVEVNILCRDGSELPADVDLNHVKTDNGISVISVIHDVSGRRRVEEIRLENINLAYESKLKSEFLANMSHELRTPLNSIIGFSQLLKQKIHGELNEKQERYVDNILTSGKFLLELINDILDLSKVEAGKLELTIEKIPVSETINETINLIKEKAAMHNIVLKLEFDPELKVIEADRRRFKQILFNLLTNAVKFSKEEGGTITITTKKAGDMAQISVSDTGIGIKEEDLGGLFKEFHQIEESRGGSGLGLAISKKLVELHGGTITAQSRYGEGSAFTFSLPIKAKKQGE
jgi:protein-histidine pros-kinase